MLDTSLDEKLKTVDITDEELIKQIENEYENAINYRKPRIEAWHANEDILYGKKPATLSGRSNVDLRLAHGFVTTFLSKIKNTPKIIFKAKKPSGIKKAKKVTAAWELESSPTREDWAYKDLLDKKLAMPYGRSINIIYATSEPYKHHREQVDPYDFLIDPLAGGYEPQKKARYWGRDNIFRSKYDLENNPKYNKEAVRELIASYSENQAVALDNEYREKQNRLAVIGLDVNNFTPQKDGIFKLLEWFTTINGLRYNIVCSLDKKQILYKGLYKKMVGVHDKEEQPEWLFTSWAYYPDAFNFWSEAPLDIVRENFQSRYMVINGALDNNEAKNRPMKSYDPKTYKNPALLKYQPDRLIPTADGKDPKAGLFIHPVNDIYDPVELDDKLESIGAKVSGVTPSSQGQADQDQKVGIYYGDMQEVADRMSLFEMSYSRDNILKAQLYLNGLRDRLDEPMAIEMIGEDGAEWDELKKDDLEDEDFGILIEGGTASSQLDAIKQKQKAEFIARNINNTNFNQKALAEQDALISGFTELEVKRLTQPDNITDDMLTRASADIERLMKGEKVNPYLKADTAYLQKILDFYSDNNLEQSQNNALQEYMTALEPIVIKNMAFKAQKEAALKGALPIPEMPGAPEVAGGEPLPGTPGGTVDRASEVTNNLKSNYVSQPNI